MEVKASIGKSLQESRMIVDDFEFHCFSLRTGMRRDMKSQKESVKIFDGISEGAQESLNWKDLDNSPRITAASVN